MFGPGRCSNHGLHFLFFYNCCQVGLLPPGTLLGDASSPLFERLQYGHKQQRESGCHGLRAGARMADIWLIRAFAQAGARAELCEPDKGVAVPRTEVGEGLLAP